MNSTENSYIKFAFSSNWDNDMLVALLTNFSFNSFEESEDNVMAYMPSSEVDPMFLEKLKEFCNTYSIKFTQENFENKNWNAEWESSYKPVTIDDFCIIKADFHNTETKKYKHIITINPEMTFGTGHHETTKMMIRLMSEINFSKLKVIDFGSGTGVLGILAEKMGAKEILAIDNDPVSVNNILENAFKNSCKKIKSELAETLNVKKYSYDIILANIERNVLLKEAENISNSLHKGGIVIISGILSDDQNLVVDTYEKHSLKYMKTLSDGDWTAMKFIAY